MRHRTVFTGNHHIHVIEAGPVQAPPIVMIHGIGVSERYFRPLMAELSDTFRVLVPDLPGFGRSPKPDHALQIGEYARIVNEWLSLETIAAPVLVGHSMGCQVATEMLSQQPGMSSKLVLIGPTVDKARHSIYSQAMRLLGNGLVDPPRTTAVVISDYIRCGPRHYIRTIKPMLDDDIEGRIAGLPVETLLVRGARDPVAQRDWVRYLQTIAPNVRLIEIKKAGHVVQYSKAPEVAQAIREFVA